MAPGTSTAPCYSGSTSNMYFYHGARVDPLTGNYQFGSRTYDPTKTSFLTPDSYREQPSSADLSIGNDPLTQNRYGYVNGDPVNLIDPTGHCAASDTACWNDVNSSDGTTHQVPGKDKPAGTTCNAACSAYYAPVPVHHKQCCDWSAAANALESQLGNIWAERGNTELNIGLQDGIIQLGQGIEAIANNPGQIPAGLLTCAQHLAACGGSMIDAQDLQSGHYTRWLGHVLPSVLLTAATIGASGFARGAIAAGDTEQPLAQLARMRGQIGAGDNDVLARLDVNDTSYYGLNGQGIYDRLPGVSFQTMRHAEGNAFGQAAYNRARGGSGTLYVDRIPCGFCVKSMAGLARSIGLDHLDVITPDGLFGSYGAEIDSFVRAAS
jgi:RHS repeat-associated protein